MATADKNKQKQKQKQKQQPPKKKKKAAALSEARLLVVFDRSGSMSTMWREATAGFKSFVEDQKKVPGQATITTAMFDTAYDLAHDNLPLADADADAVLKFGPRGMTALYDAIGKTINQALAQRVKKGTRTLLAIITDGAENSSKEFTHDQVQGLIKRVQSENGWEVVFLGANIDAVSVGTGLGVRLSKSATFDASGIGATAAINTLNLVAASYRSMDAGVYASVNDSLLNATTLYQEEEAKAKADNQSKGSSATKQ